jgi:hypothetical protein
MRSRLKSNTVFAFKFAALQSASPAISQKGQLASLRGLSSFFISPKGSLSELDTQFELARLLGYLKPSEWHTMNDKLMHVDHLISGLIRHLRTGK